MRSDQFVLIGATRTDLWTVGAVLDDCPVGAHFCILAIENYRNIGHQVDCPRPLLTGALSDAAREIGYSRPAGGSAERRIPSTAFGKQRRHFGKLTVVKSEAIFRQDFSDRILVLKCRR